MIDDITNKALAELADAGRARRASAMKAAASVTDAADRLALYLELMRDAGRFNAATLAEDTSTPPPVVADYLIEAHRRRLLVSLGDGWYCVKPDAPALSDRAGAALDQVTPAPDTTGMTIADNTTPLDHIAASAAPFAAASLNDFCCGNCGGRVGVELLYRRDSDYHLCVTCFSAWRVTYSHD